MLEKIIYGYNFSSKSKLKQKWLQRLILDVDTEN